MLKKFLVAAAVAGVAVGGLAAVPATAQSYYQHDGYNGNYGRSDGYRQDDRYRNFERQRQWEQYRRYQQDRHADYGRAYGNRYPHYEDGRRYWHRDHIDDRSDWGR